MKMQKMPLYEDIQEMIEKINWYVGKVDVCWFFFNIKTSSMSAIVIHVCRIEEVCIFSGMQQRDASFEPQENFSSVWQLPVQTALNAQSPTLLWQYYTKFFFSVQRSIFVFLHNILWKIVNDSYYTWYFTHRKTTYLYVVIITAKKHLILV